MNIRTVLVLDWEPDTSWVSVTAHGTHRSLGDQELCRVLAETEGPLDALRDYIAAVEETEKHWKGIPDA